MPVELGDIHRGIIVLGVKRWRRRAPPIVSEIPAR
jgi:hypothetical protein